MLFGGKRLIMRVLPYPPETEITTLLLVTWREWGALALSLMFCFAARNPARKVAIVYGIIVALCIMARTAGFGNASGDLIVMMDAE